MLSFSFQTRLRKKTGSLIAFGFPRLTGIVGAKRGVRRGIRETEREKEREERRRRRGEKASYQIKEENNVLYQIKQKEKKSALSSK